MPRKAVGSDPGAAAEVARIPTKLSQRKDDVFDPSFGIEDFNCRQAVVYPFREDGSGLFYGIFFAGRRADVLLLVPSMPVRTFDDYLVDT